MTKEKLINHLEHLAKYVKYSEDAPALREVIEMLTERAQERTETHACYLISRADVEQTVEDNILCYTHSDRPIDQDPDTECHKAIRTALKMLRKDLRKLPSAQPEQRWIPCSLELPEETGKYLVTVKNGNVYAGTYDGYSKRFQCEAIAWMPLPAPYQGEGEENDR